MHNKMGHMNERGVVRYSDARELEHHVSTFAVILANCGAAFVRDLYGISNSGSTAEFCRNIVILLIQ